MSRRSVARLSIAATGVLALIAAGQPASGRRAPNLCWERQQISASQFVSAQIFGPLAATSTGKLLTSIRVGGIERPASLDPLERSAAKIIEGAPAGELQAVLPGDRLLVSADTGGNEQYHLLAWRPGDLAIDLFKDQKVTAEFQGWSADRKSFFVSVNETDPRYFDLYQFDALTLERHRVMKGGDYRLSRPGLNHVALSPDAARIAVEQIRSNIASDVLLVDRASGATRNLTADPGNSFSRPLTFEPKSDKLLYVSDRIGERQRLRVRDVTTGRDAPVPTGPGDVQYAQYSPSGSWLALLLNDQDELRLELRDTSRGTRIKPQGLPRGVVRSLEFDPVEHFVDVIVATPWSPGEIYRVDLPSGRSRLVASAWPDWHLRNLLIRPTHVTVRADDGLPLAGVLFDGSCGGGKQGVVWVHGGPNGQSRMDYQQLLQFLALHGKSVLALNFRGSFGSGKTFAALDDHHYGESDSTDLVDGGHYLIQHGLAAKDHTALVGGSFGGYLTLSTLTRHPHSFAAGVDLFGIGDWERVLKSMPVSWASRRIALTTEIGDPDRDGGVYLRSISPIHQMARLAVPLFVMQGVNDPRVPKSESEAVAAAARRAGVPVDFLLLDGEGHNWPNRPDNQVRALSGIDEFLNRYIGAARR